MYIILILSLILRVSIGTKSDLDSRIQYTGIFYSKSLDGRRTTDFVHFKTIHDFALFALIYLEINKLKSLTLKVCFIQIPRQ